MSEHLFSVNRLYARAVIQSADRLALVLPAELRKAVENNARLPLTTLDALWEAYCSASADPLAGLRLGLELHAGHLDCAGMLLVSCDTLGEALEELGEVAPIVGEGGEFLIDNEGDMVTVRYQSHLALRQAERVEAVLAGLLQISTWATGGAFRPAGLSFTHQPLAAQADYRALLRIPVSFGQPSNVLRFSASALGLPLIQANSTLREHLRGLTDKVLAELGHASLAAEVQRMIRTHPRWGKERVAERLNVSGRHLNRRLAEEGTSFKLLRDASLHAVAVEQLRGDSPLRDVAERLGFSDESAFTKAFRRWTGQTPANFRRQRESTPRTSGFFVSGSSPAPD